MFSVRQTTGVNASVPIAPESAYRADGVWPMVRLFHLSAHDVSHALSHAPEARLIALFAIPVAVISVLTGFVAGYFGWSTGLLHLLAVYLVLERLAPHVQAIGFAPSVCGPENTRRISLTPSEVTIDAQPGTTMSQHDRTHNVHWHALSGYYSCPGGLVLLMPDRHWEFLPRVWFSAYEYQCLVEVVQSQAPRYRRARLKIFRPLLVTAVVLAVWLMWETPLVW